jgi:uncharacterized phage protein (TIGR01671 family)
MKNRAIKFRVWDNEEKVWSSNFIVDCLNFPSNRIVSISQFTGLFDQHGNEIWEGDIVEINYYKINIPWWKNLSHKIEIDQQAQKERNEYNTARLPIVFHDGQFVAKNDYILFDSQNLKYSGHTEHGKTHWCDTEEKSWGYVVVGNIYENPELLTNA